MDEEQIRNQDQCKIINPSRRFSERNKESPKPKNATTYSCAVTLALEGTTQVIDNDGSTSGTKEEGISLTKTIASTSDDNDLAVESKLRRHYECDFMRGI